MEHVQCRLYFCIAGAYLTRNIVSFQVTFDEGSMCLFDKESLDVFKSSVDKSLDLGYLMDGKKPTPVACWKVPAARGWQRFLQHGLPDELKWEFRHTVQSVVNKSKCFAKTYLMIYTIGHSGKKLTLTNCTASHISTNDLAAGERPGIGASLRKSDPRTSSSWTTSKEI